MSNLRGQHSEDWKRLLVIYDVEDNKRRNKVVRILEGYGVRVQKSAFECYIAPTSLLTLQRQLNKVIGANDSIRIYEIRPECFDVSKAGAMETYSFRVAII